MAIPSPNGKRTIERIRYQPAKRYPFDLEIFSASDLKSRTSEEVMLRTFNYEFFMLILVTSGHCVQFVDFNSVSCAQGNVIILQPGQAHNFGRDKDWDGWIILFRPEFVLAAPTQGHDIRLLVDQKLLPEQVTLGSNELHRVTDLIAQMRADTHIDAPVEDVHALLQYQILLLLKILSIRHGKAEVSNGDSAYPLLRFKQFKTLVEEHYANWHQVIEYSKQLGCTERTLSRATLLAVGVTAKAFIASRINLEAKRMLAHTDLRISAIAERLGFEETTHFTKFFKRETGCTPSEFRQKQNEIFSEGNSTK
ncbi:AraC family transcriptional regulator [Burkholderia stagnalis]|uniref:AraC family transcriptional regulator n=1 Tax=Burkholderia stagnalis TaxID=1503054 RepID=UPI0009C063D9|nr:AraC family transcriptional regulator [Burkholderia stagnalis]